MDPSALRLFSVFSVLASLAIFHPQGSVLAAPSEVETSERSLEARFRQLGTEQVPGPLRLELRQRNLDLGAPMLVRTFKQQSVPRTDLTPRRGEGLLQVWLQRNNGIFELFKAYPIAMYSGKLGPKLAQGDRQTPEGIYGVTAPLLNPNSTNHLAMNIGYPNPLDASLGRTGDFIMIHGKATSIGCFAMTDPLIEEIYTLAEAALLAGQETIQVHSFPFPLTMDNLNAGRKLQWGEFWSNLLEVYDYFESFRVPPMVEARDGRYVIVR